MQKYRSFPPITRQTTSLEDEVKGLHRALRIQTTGSNWNLLPLLSKKTYELENEGRKRTYRRRRRRQEPHQFFHLSRHGFVVRGCLCALSGGSFEFRAVAKRIGKQGLQKPKNPQNGAVSVVARQPLSLSIPFPSSFPLCFSVSREQPQTSVQNTYLHVCV